MSTRGLTVGSGRLFLFLPGGRVASLTSDRNSIPFEALVKRVPSPTAPEPKDMDLKNAK